MLVWFRHRDGRIVPFLIDSNVNYTEAGAFNHTRCFIRDDTGRRVNEASRFFFSLPNVGQSQGGGPSAFKAYLPLKTERAEPHPDTKKDRAPLATFQTIPAPITVVKSEFLAQQGCFQTVRTPRVLIVEDSGLCAKLLSRMVVKDGCLTEWALNGAQGVEK